MKYLILFELKRLCRNKKNIIALVILLLITILYIYISGKLDIQKKNFELENCKNEITYNQESLNTYKESNNAKESIVKMLEEKIQFLNELEKALNENDWKKTLNCKISLDENYLQGVLSSRIMTSETSETIQNRIDINKYLLEHNIKPVNEYSITSYNFILMVEKELFPLVIVIILLIISDVIYNEVNERTIKLLLIQPISRNKILFSKIISSIIISLVIISMGVS
jgi:ABC-type transport system involved in multi-copper enzyme maturation, permease component